MRVRQGGLIPAAVLGEVARRAEASPRREACGFVARRASGALEVIDVPNAVGPERAAVAFEMDAAAEARVLTRLAQEGGEVVALYHSHLEAPAEPSADDVAGAFCAGVPLWPGAEHLIVSVRGGRAVELRRYRAEQGQLRPVAPEDAPPGPADPPD